MAVVSHRYALVLFPIPKNASTSLKRAVYELDTGRSMDMGSNPLRAAHDYYPHIRDERWLRCYSEYTSLVVVRDPIKRLLSAYANKVVHRRVLEEPRVARLLAKKSLAAVPSLEEFVENLRQYRKISSVIHRHTIPQSKYVGKIWRRLKHRIPIEGIAQIPEIFERVTGQNVSLSHDQVGGPKMLVSDLSKPHFEKLVRVYRADYRMLTGIYSPEDLSR